MYKFLLERTYIEMNHEKLKRIDHIFKIIKSKPTDEKRNKVLTDKISMELKSIFNINAEIKVLYNTTDYILRIYPSKEELEGYAVDILESKSSIKFKQCTGVVIEISQEFLKSKRFSPRELTAGLLHEIGHIYYRRKIFVFMESFFSFVLKFIGPIMNLLIPKLILIPFMICINTLIIMEYHLRDIEIRKEIDADSFAVLHGYSLELNSLLEKVISNINRRSKKQKSYTEISMRLLEVMKNRQKGILELLKKEANDVENDEYVREILKDQINKMEKNST